MQMEIDDWSDTVTTVDSTPATKADLGALENTMKADLDALENTMKADLGALENRMKDATKADLDALELRFDGKLANYPTKQDLADALAKFAREDLASAFNVALEQMRIFIGALDDKHTHRTDQLRHDLDVHRADATVHRAPRTRKTGSR